MFFVTRAFFFCAHLQFVNTTMAPSLHIVTDDRTLHLYAVQTHVRPHRRCRPGTNQITISPRGPSRVSDANDCFPSVFQRCSRVPFSARYHTNVGRSSQKTVYRLIPGSHMRNKQPSAVTAVVSAVHVFRLDTSGGRRVRTRNKDVKR